ncbi:MAG: 1-(5-phosphoribosyl)-5-[(5-phosphoribosylamino)methylideneamino]imidazole-4-carboxamide isomerase [Oscillospiraceae bacterium]|jgi:phosphoribosylformimino-5-aminoimidazole carboxamide ribotide isomerase|nr:1-(5-phosphoribosyl)-5-[(5-phosphoribosylamino)methylideneamino]imidazole-4-carboxamide isomerase [Oscillospiraceae bacterium]
MLIFPAIDIKNGNVVRLIKGDFATVHTVADDAFEVTADFIACGAEHLHLVDLDGARDGVRANAALVSRLCGCGLRVELGGGLRSTRDLEEADALGVSRFVIGSAAVSDRAFVESAATRFGERVAVGIDALDGKVRTHGWERDSGIDAVQFAKEMRALGVRNIIFTDISTDGTLAGPPLDALAELRSALPDIMLTASGGIAKLRDITALRGLGIDAAIVGKAYYAGTLNLRQAIETAGKV